MDCRVTRKRCNNCFNAKLLIYFRSPSAEDCKSCEDAKALSTDEYRVDLKVKPKFRICLKCDREFKSYGKRICEGCTLSNKQYEGVEYYGIIR